MCRKLSGISPRLALTTTLSSQKSQLRRTEQSLMSCGIQASACNSQGLEDKQCNDSCHLHFSPAHASERCHHLQPTDEGTKYISFQLPCASCSHIHAQAVLQCSISQPMRKQPVGSPTHRLPGILQL